MLYQSAYKKLDLPDGETVPSFVLRYTSEEVDKKPLLFPSVNSTRKNAAPLSLADVRTNAYAMATALLSKEISNVSWKKGDVMAFYTGNQHDYLMAALGVMLAGGVPALINPMYKPEELSHAFNLTQPRSILASASTYEGACKAAADFGKEFGQEIDVFVLDEAHESSVYERLIEPGKKARAAGEKSVESVKIDPVHDEAVFCFSSGTSGMPKTVRLSHKNLVANMIQMTATLGGRVNKPLYDPCGWYDQPLAPAQDGFNEVHYSLLPQFHCYGLICALINLHTATPSVIEAKFSAESFFRAVQDCKVTFTFVVPPILIALVRSPLADNYDLSSIKSVASGAAYLSKELCDMVYERYRISITDGYGMTETSPIIALQTQKDLSLKKLNVGRLVANTEAKIVDINTQEFKGPNQIGELWVRGPQVMLGYLKNDEANESTFVPNAHATDRFLKTGDVASIDEQGYITLHDRVKDIIKYNGYQVAASELEKLVYKLPFVLDCAVVAKIVKDDASNNELPWACIVVKPNASEESDEGREQQVLTYVNERVSGFKKLRGVTWMDALPRTYVCEILMTVRRARCLNASCAIWCQRLDPSWIIYGIPIWSSFCSVLTSGTTPFAFMRYDTTSHARACAAVFSKCKSTVHRSAKRRRLAGAAPRVGRTRLGRCKILRVARSASSTTRSSTMARSRVSHCSSRVSSCSTNSWIKSSDRFLQATCIAIPFFNAGSAPVASKRHTSGMLPRCTAIASGYP